jgi:hypothetical protein
MIGILIRLILYHWGINLCAFCALEVSIFIHKSSERALLFLFLKSIPQGCLSLATP